MKDYFIENNEMDYYLINIPFTKDDFQYSEIESIFRGKHDNAHLLNDKDMNFLNKLKLQSVPTFLILDEEGSIIYSKIGYRSSDKKEITNQLNLAQEKK